MQKSIRAISLVALVIALTASKGFAQESLSATGDFSIENYYRTGMREAAVGTGAFFSPVGPTHNRPIVNYVLLSAQLGWMISDVRGEGFFRGNWEFVPEIFGAAIHQTTGSYIAGSTTWLRYNFVPRGSRFVPYVQGGIGVTWLDVDHRYTGQDFNFNVDAATGVRYYVRPRWSLYGEFRYQHISNANTGDRNIGINAVGPIFGLARHF